MSLHRIALEEEDRQLVVMAIAHLGADRPGWRQALRAIADRLKAGEMFDGFENRRVEHRAAQRTEMQRERDREWSAELETGYGSAYTPEQMGPFVQGLLLASSRLAIAAHEEQQLELEKQPNAAQAFGRAFMQRVLECDEQTGPDGLCDCGRYAALQIVKARASRGAPA